MKPKSFRLIIMLFFICSAGFAQSLAQKEKNLRAFADLYGQVRFFHPSDEAAKVNWFLFSLYGAGRVMDAKNDQQLIAELKALVLLIAPSVIVDSFPISKKLVLNNIVPYNTGQIKQVNWVHRGLSLYGGSPTYKSERENRDTVSTIYDDYPLSTIIMDKALEGNYEFTVEVIGDSSDCKNYKLFIAAFNEHKQLRNKSANNTLSGRFLPYRFMGTFSKGTTSVNFTLRIPKNRNIRINKPKITIKVGKSVETVEFKKAFNKQKASENIYLIIADDKKFYPTSATSISDIVSLKLGKGLYASVPSTLYATSAVTYPHGDGAVFEAFKKKLKDNWISRPLKYNKDARFANVVMVWSVLKFAFPYWKDTDTDPEKLFSFLFAKTIEDKNDLDFLETLRLMSAKLNDGHMGIFYDGPDRVPEKSIGLVSEKIKDKIYVKQVLDSSLKAIPIGSIIDSIDYESALKTFQGKFRLISGSPQWRSYKSLLGLFDSSVDTVKLVLNDGGSRKVLKLARNGVAQEYRPIALPGFIPEDGLISDNIYYFNLTGDSVVKKISASLNQLKDAKSLIFDMRGYPKEDVNSVLSHLLRCSEHTRWMHTPFLNANGTSSHFESKGWDLGASYPHFEGRIIFLSDACAQSWSESILGYVKGLKLGTIIGKATSGTNGELQTISLLDDFAVYYTGMKTTNADGSVSHLKGIIPDIVVTSTPSGIREGRDEVLEKALDFAKKQL
jgi:hypothetical protein